MKKTIKVSVLKNVSENVNLHIGLKCLFEPMRRLPITKNRLKIIIEDHIYQLGYQSIEQISAKAIQVYF
jgi:hypothetical protein